MKKLLVGIAAALALSVALAPPALASPQTQLEKYTAPDVALLDQAAPGIEAKIAPIADKDKAAGKKKSGEKDEATNSGKSGRAQLVAYPLRL